jgi:hypothetical protein
VEHSDLERATTVTTLFIACKQTENMGLTGTLQQTQRKIKEPLQRLQNSDFQEGRNIQTWSVPQLLQHYSLLANRQRTWDLKGHFNNYSIRIKGTLHNEHSTVQKRAEHLYLKLGTTSKTLFIACKQTENMGRKETL